MDLNKLIEESRANWISWAEKRCEGVDDESVIDEYKHYALNEYVVDVIKIAKKYFILKMD